MDQHPLDGSSIDHCLLSLYFAHLKMQLSHVILAGAVGVQACSGPIANAATVDLVASFEGWRPSECKSSITHWKIYTIHIYDTSNCADTDPTGNPTIGYGHLCRSRGCPDVPYPKPLSMADGKKLLSSDLAVGLLTDMRYH